jgi:hypothetical protein
LERAERQNELEKAARLRYGTLRDLEDKLVEGEKRLKELPGEARFSKKRSTAKKSPAAEEVFQRCRIRCTGIPDWEVQ